MRLATGLCYLTVCIVLVSSVEGKKSFSTRRKSGGNSRRGNQQHKQQQPQQPHQAPAQHSTAHDSNTNFLNYERAGTSHGSASPGATNTHYRGSPFDAKPSAPQPPKQSAPQTNGPIGFEKMNSEVQRKPNVQSAPSSGANAPPYPVNSPNGPPPAYPGYGSSNTHGGFEAPPAYPGRPQNAPPVYIQNNPNYPKSPGYPTQQNSHQQASYPQQQWHQPPQGFPGQHNLGGGYGGYPNQGHSQGGFGGYPNQGGFGGYPNQGGFGGYPNQGGLGGYPNQGGFGGGFGGNPQMGGFGQSHPNYGGSPFGQSSSFGGGSPFGFGGNSFGGGYGNNYSPNNFGYSSKPGLFGSLFGGGSNHYNGFGYQKRRRFGFGGLPLPIPIPIFLPMGGFGGGFGGGYGRRSSEHQLLDAFLKNQTLDSSDNDTSVYILNNSTVTPCTTDQFIYDSLNITVLSCTAANCTAIKVFTTTNVSGEVSTHSAGITLCLEGSTTYSSFADNVNPKVSDLRKYLMKVCRSNEGVNTTGNSTDVKLVQTIFNETVVKETTATLEQPESSSTSSTMTTELPVESTTQSTVESTTAESATVSTTAKLTSVETNLTDFNSTVSNSTYCEIFHCSSIELCMPSIEIVDRCSSPDCPFSRTGYQPCVKIKMCKSPFTPISTFATLNTTFSRIDQYNNVTSVHDEASLTLISYIPQMFSVQCSENSTDSSCTPPPASQSGSLPTQQICAPSTSPDVMSGSGSPSGSCIPAQVPELTQVPEIIQTSTESTITPTG